MTDEHADSHGRDVRPVPDGEKYFDFVLRMESACEKATRDWIASASDSAEVTRKALLRALALLDTAGSCFWGCDRKDHTIRYMVGRACSSATAALRLLEMGHYDESIGLTRSIGEIANLLFLFDRDPNSFEMWKNASKKERLSAFSPYQIRLRLEALTKHLPMSAERYSLMSETAIHVTPQMLPQTYNPHGQPMLGGYFQSPGAIVALNELAYITALALLITIKLVDVPAQGRNAIIDGSKELYDSVGRIDLAYLPTLWEELRREGRTHPT